jgi:hypothetical protein
MRVFQCGRVETATGNRQADQRDDGGKANGECCHWPEF